jgi:2-polyprenyl-6-methoxyphenol hydroxylase-like FAD-dependent oxidoreductase
VPLPDERVYWFATLSTPPGQELGNDREALRELFGSWHRPIPDLIEATPDDAVLRHDIYDLAELPASFVTRRGVLLGDAAHAMTPDLGQGAGQAIEDAATLVLLLRTFRGAPAEPDLSSALGRYSRLRRARTRALWRQSRLTGTVAQIARPIGAGLRDTALRASPASLMTRAISRLQRWRAP